MKKANNSIWMVVVLLVLTVSVVGLITMLLADSPSDYLYRERSMLRGIETTIKKWLNGHLGIFFRFKELGNLNWLAPLLLAWFLIWKKPERWHLAMVMAVGSMVVIVGLKGYHNVRYQMTVIPFLFTVCLLLLWEFLKDRANADKAIVLVVLCGVLVFNVFYHFDDFRYLWAQRISGERPYFPNLLVEKLNTLELPHPRSRVLVVNQPVFYYYTDKMGIDVLHPAVKRSGVLRNSGDRVSAFYALKDQLHVSHILIGWLQEGQFREKILSEILDLDCRQILNDRGYRLYKLRDMPLERLLDSEPGIKMDMWTPRSVRGELIRPRPRIVGKNGRFHREFRKEDGVDILMVRRDGSGAVDEAVLQIGYEFRARPGDWRSYRYIYMLASVKVDKRSLNSRNLLFIQDWDSQWQRITRHLRRSDWRRYVIFKKLRPHASRVSTGFIFRPRSDSEVLRIKDVCVYFVNREF